VSYYAFNNIDQGITTLLNIVAESESLFLDGLIFPPQQIRLSSVEKDVSSNQRGTVIMHGVMTGGFKKQLPAQRVGWKTRIHGGTFYYEHVRALLADHLQRRCSEPANQTVRGSGHQPTPEPFFQEVISMEDYLFRYDYGAFWMARPMAFELSKLTSYLPFVIGLFIASYRWIRFLTGSMFTTKNLFQLLKRAPEAVVAKRMVIQDCYIPTESTKRFLIWVCDNIPLTTPIWLCPVKSNNNQPFTPSYSSRMLNEDPSSATFHPMMINCGIYGRVSDGRGVIHTQQLEAMCQAEGGRKMLYAQNHYSENEFWDVFDHNTYERVRENHSAAEAFPSLYEKTCGVPAPLNTWTESIISLFL
jgi:hypothetical protein